MRSDAGFAGAPGRPVAWINRGRRVAGRFRGHQHRWGSIVDGELGCLRPRTLLARARQAKGRAAEPVLRVALIAVELRFGATRIAPVQPPNR